MSPPCRASKIDPVRLPFVAAGAVIVVAVAAVDVADRLQILFQGFPD